MDLIVDRRSSRLVFVHLGGISVPHRRFYTGSEDLHHFASYTLDHWSRARIVPTDRVGYPVEMKMIQEVRAAVGLMAPTPIESLIPPIYRVRMAEQAFRM